MTKKSIRSTVAASVLMCILAVALVIVAGGNADAATAKKYTKSVTLTMNKEQKTFNLKKYMKKGDKIKESSVDKLSLSKIRSEVYYISSKKISVWDTYEEAKNATFKIKTKKKGTLKIKLQYTDEYRKSIDADWDSNDEDYNPKDVTDFDNADEETAFNKIVEGLNYYLDKDLDESYAEITAKIYEKSRKFKATIPIEQKRASILQMYIYTLNMYYNYDEDHNPKHGEVPNPWQAILNGTYKGVCGESARRVIAIAKAAGFNASGMANADFNHSWAVVESRDLNGKFWYGIAGTSFAPNVKWNENAFGWTWNEGESLKDAIKRQEYHPVWE